ncbi:MAG: GNAT family N-acetyltransferase, partial [Candidatus Omnitrophica bacterium]|nr:GNAT family N-acetyltransferase [Candidatus Omnitrophota bacterium]
MQFNFNHLEVTLAQDEEDIRQSQQLRKEIFASHRKDCEYECDEYDRFCDHLIVKDKSKNLVVGTYRLLPSFKAQATGFHAE